MRSSTPLRSWGAEAGLRAMPKGSATVMPHPVRLVAVERVAEHLALHGSGERSCRGAASVGGVIVDLIGTFENLPNSSQLFGVSHRSGFEEEDYPAD